MITVGIIRNGANYFSHHLRKNGYWAEREKATVGGLQFFSGLANEVYKT